MSLIESIPRVSMSFVFDLSLSYHPLWHTLNFVNGNENMTDKIQFELSIKTSITHSQCTFDKVSGPIFSVFQYLLALIHPCRDLGSAKLQ